MDGSGGIVGVAGPVDLAGLGHQEEALAVVQQLDALLHIVGQLPLAASGVQFAILRAGYRGYTEGSIQEDAYFEQNLAGAIDAGLDVGVYFFSQAMDEQEAREEASYACELIGTRKLDLPLFYDWETVSGSERIPTPDGLPLTDCAVAFCKVVRRNGFEAGVYFNQSLGYRYFDLSKLHDYTLWLAEYDTTPEFHYHFDCLQYTDTGTVAGIEGGVDLDILFLPETTSD